MSIENMFEQASRNKLRFDTKVGLLTVEDLWNLPLTSKTKACLDDIAIALNNELKSTGESFVSTSTKDPVTELKFEIVKYIIQTRMDENKRKLEAEQKRAKREQINELIARKEAGALENLSLEELKELANQL